MLLQGEGSRCLIALDISTHSGVDFFSLPLLDAPDHFCHQIAIDPDVSQLSYAANTLDEMVALVQDCGLSIGPDDFRALLRKGNAEFWLVRGGTTINPIAHLQQLFRA